MVGDKLRIREEFEKATGVVRYTSLVGLDFLGGDPSSSPQPDRYYQVNEIAEKTCPLVSDWQASPQSHERNDQVY